MFWLGNEWGPCGDSEFKCLRETISRSSYTKDVVGKFLPAIESGRIMFGKVWERIIGESVDSEDTGENYSSTIKVLIDKIQTIKNSNPKFVFVHEMAPHEPYKYGSNCEVVDREEGDPSDPKNVRRYLTNSICALKSTLQALALIRQHDREAVIVVQADHGEDFTEGVLLWEKDIKETGFSMATPGIKNRMGILNYMFLPESCPLEIDTLQTNVQTAQAAVACALGYTPKLTSGESYWGVYRTNPSSFGFVKNITPLKDLSFPQEK